MQGGAVDCPVDMSSWAIIFADVRFLDYASIYSSIKISLQDVAKFCLRTGIFYSIVLRFPDSLRHQVFGSNFYR